MDKPKHPPEGHAQQALTQKLGKCCHELQKLEQRLSLTGHHCDQVVLHMQQIRQDILNQILTTGQAGRENL